MERIVALVEGHTEEYFIRSTIPNALVQRPIPNGQSVTIETICTAIVDHLEVVSGAIRHVLILLDLEARQISAEEMAEAIVIGIQKSSSGRRFHVGVANRQIENWILADQEEMRRRFEDPNFQYAGDGSYGKPALLALMKNKSIGPRDKAALLRSCSCNRASQNSPSLAALARSVDFEWYWIAS